MIWLVVSPLALAMNPDDLAAALPGAREQLDACGRVGCQRSEAARAAWLLALGSYVHEGRADGDLAATVAALDPELHASLPEVVRDATGVPPPWAARVGGSQIAGQAVSAEPMETSPRDHPQLRDQVRARPDPKEQLTETERAGHIEAWDRYAEAQQAQSTGKLKTAIYLLRDLAQSDTAPPSATDCALISMARIYVDVGQDEHASMLYDQVETESLVGTAEVEGAMTRLFMGQLKAARRPLKRHQSDPLAQAAMQAFDL